MNGNSIVNPCELVASRTGPNKDMDFPPFGEQVSDKVRSNKPSSASDERVLLFHWLELDAARVK